MSFNKLVIFLLLAIYKRTTYTNKIVNENDIIIIAADNYLTITK